MEPKLTTLDEFLKQDKLESKFPYPGLRAFEPHESEIYFGRESQVHELGNKLDINHFITVIGPSGCGKSSLVKAGLIPELESGLLLSAGPKWASVTLTPGSDPLYSLSVQLSKIISTNGKKLSPIDVRRLLSEGDDAIQRSLNEGAFPSTKNLLILVDQFEELFRYHSGVDVAKRFVDFLVNIYNVKPKNIFVIITMRSDYIGDCNYFDEFSKVITNTLYLTPQLKESDLEKAISYPARLFNAEVETKLVKRLLSDAKNENDPLPLLQHVLLWMWKLVLTNTNDKSLIHLTLDDYINPPICGLNNALSNHAQQLYDGLSEEQKRLTEIIFRLINQKDKGQREIRRVVKLSEILNTANIENINNDLVQVIKTYSALDVSFIRFSGKDIEKLNLESDLDVGHESLIRNWSTLNEWNGYEYISRKNLLDVLDDAERYEIDSKIGYLPDGKINLYEHGWNHDKKIFQWEGNWPNYKWSSRYLKDKNIYNLASRYFKDSKSNVAKEFEKQKRLIQEKEEEERRQFRDQLTIRRNRIFLFLASMVLAGFMVLGILLSQALDEEKIAKNEAEIAKNKAELSDEKAKIALAHHRILNADTPNKLSEIPKEAFLDIKMLKPVIDSALNAKSAYFNVFDQTKPKQIFNLFDSMGQKFQKSDRFNVKEIRKSPDKNNEIYAISIMDVSNQEWQIFLSRNGVSNPLPIYRSTLDFSLKNSKPEFTFLDDQSLVVIGLDKILHKWSGSDLLKANLPDPKLSQNYR